ncbi:four helix bundle protein [Thermodesulfobacteriota bacterium]
MPFGRNTTAAYLRSLHIAHGSSCELETQIVLSGDQGYLNMASLSELLRDVGDPSNFGPLSPNPPSVAGFCGG